MDLKFKRARSQENKEKRFSDIPDVSAELYDKSHYAGLTFEEISKIRSTPALAAMGAFATVALAIMKSIGHRSSFLSKRTMCP